MDEQRVGALVVVDGARPVGLVTDRDVALHVLAEEHDAAATSIAELVDEPPVTLSEDRSIHEASESMRQLGMRRMPVVDEGGQLVGMLSADDLVRRVAGGLGYLSDVASEQVPSSRRPVKEAVHRADQYAEEMVTTQPGTSSRDVARQMRSESVGCVVVVEGSGAPIGLVTDRDLTRRVVAKGLDPDATRVEDVMTAPVVVADASESLPQV